MPAALVRLARSPFAAVGRWWDRRCIKARMRWAEGDLLWIARQRERDIAKEAALKAYLAELRVQLALVER